MSATPLGPSFADKTDFENANRGFIDALNPCIIKSPTGRTVWDNDQYAFLNEQCPPTANPKLWRQGQLCSIQGLFLVTEGIYQVRGFDLSNITFVEGEKGIVVIDPLISPDCAAAALDLYRKHRGDRPVTGCIFSHSHGDHFGGAPGILPQTGEKVPIVAPEGFMEEATSENLLVGPAMYRRSGYMYGKALDRSPTGQIGCGLGMGVSNGGELSLVPPNTTIYKTGEELTIDGVRIVFQMVPNTEAPAEMNMYFPQKRAFLIAECATHCLHNVITLRGAMVRDARAWAKHLDESIYLYGEESDVLFGSHHWPTWGTGPLCQRIAEQRDTYAYLHDQTVRLMNQGLTGIEIAEVLEMPPKLQQAWHVQGFYGSVSHNVKGIYQRYLTWFDGNPANLWKHPPQQEAKRYVDCMGGADQVIRKAEAYISEGDLRFATTILDHVVQSDPENSEAMKLLADVYERLGFGAENGTWRNFYLTGALDLRHGKVPLRGANHNTRDALPPLKPALTVSQWFDSLSVRIDGKAAANDDITIDFHVTDQNLLLKLIVSNGALTYRVHPVGEASSTQRAAFEISTTKDKLHEILTGQTSIGSDTGRGDHTVLVRLLEYCGFGTKPKLAL